MADHPTDDFLNDPFFEYPPAVQEKLKDFIDSRVRHMIDHFVLEDLKSIRSDIRSIKKSQKSITKEFIEMCDNWADYLQGDMPDNAMFFELKQKYLDLQKEIKQLDYLFNLIKQTQNRITEKGKSPKKKTTKPGGE